MKKSVYSLVLSDDVIEAVDRCAYAAGMSRSAYINRVLADAVSYVTPEKRMSDILGGIVKLMTGESFRIQEQPSDSMLSIRSALRYRYKPVIRYSVELYRSFEKTIGKLKVSFRTQSQSLISVFSDFTGLWISLERRYILPHVPEGIEYTAEDGRFTRTFCLPPEKRSVSDEEIAAAISEYIRMLDDVLKLYFANADSPDAGRLAAERYRQYAENGIVII